LDRLNTYPTLGSRCNLHQGLIDMSGHSKWSTIKRKKGATDAKRGQVFYQVWQRDRPRRTRGGPDPNANFKLRLVVDKAKAANMPKDNIERANPPGRRHRKGRCSGRGHVRGLWAARRGGPGPRGDDNRNRAVSDVRRLFNRVGGALGEAAVSPGSSRKRAISLLNRMAADQDEIFNIAVEYGADDVAMGGDLIRDLYRPGEF